MTDEEALRLIRERSPTVAYARWREQHPVETPATEGGTMIGMDEVEGMTVLQLEPGDALVVRVRGFTSADNRAALANRMTDLFPGLKDRIVVLENGAEIGVIRAPKCA